MFLVPDILADCHLPNFSRSRYILADRHLPNVSRSRYIIADRHLPNVFRKAIGARLLDTFILGPSVLEPNLDLRFGQIQLLGEEQPSRTRHVLHSTVLGFHVHGLLAGECRSLAPHNSVLPDSTASNWKQKDVSALSLSFSLSLSVVKMSEIPSPLPTPSLPFALSTITSYMGGRERL